MNVNFSSSDVDAQVVAISVPIQPVHVRVYSHRRGVLVVMRAYCTSRDHGESCEREREREGRGRGWYLETVMYSSGLSCTE